MTRASSPAPGESGSSHDGVTGASALEDALDAPYYCSNLLVWVAGLSPRSPVRRPPVGVAPGLPRASAPAAPTPSVAAILRGASPACGQESLRPHRPHPEPTLTGPRASRRAP